MTGIAAEAHATDLRIAMAWADHPHRFEVAPAASFLAKAARAVETPFAKP